ncbi:MAG TPA: beta-ketoacyl-ACP synthase II [Dehalococcoidia bacterium]|nr:beta-ketoacyl-ACP synthase II [Dehalococcoidia bacterium]
MAEFPRVVVTGVGMVTPLGLDAPSSWKAMLEGRSGTGRITAFDPEAFEVQVAAEVKGFSAEELMDRRTARRSGRHTHMAVVAAFEAVASAGLTIDDGNRDAIGAIIASSGALFTIGEQERIIEERGPSRVDPLTVPKVGQYSAAVRVARLLEVRGPNSSVNSACASGGDAIGQALNLIRLGQAECMLAGGSEAMISPVVIASLGGLGALTKTWNHQPERASRPFDAKRSGFVLGEGAAVLVLETEEFARRRGASIICELGGAGWSFDATDDAAPDVDGQALAMRRALANASLTMDDIDYFNAHGTSTQLNDKTETAAIKQVFGERAYGIPVSSTKSMTGHLAAAAGAVEAAVCVLALRDQTLPPTINYEFPDPECDLDYVTAGSRRASVRAVLSNSFGLGGQNNCLVFKRFE